MSGLHTVVIRDANNCTYEMEVTVLPPFTPPVVTATVDYFCDGDGTITVTPDNSDYTYTYELDAVLNTPANCFLRILVSEPIQALHK